MNFKSILLAAAVGLTTLGVVPEAQAKALKRKRKAQKLRAAKAARKALINKLTFK